MQAYFSGFMCVTGLYLLISDLVDMFDFNTKKMTQLKLSVARSFLVAASMPVCIFLCAQIINN